MGKINEIERKRYVLTVRVPISGIDDCDARLKSKNVMSEIKSLVDWSDKKQVKLQEVFDNREPRGVWLINND